MSNESPIASSAYHNALHQTMALARVDMANSPSRPSAECDHERKQPLPFVSPNPKPTLRNVAEATRFAFGASCFWLGAPRLHTCLRLSSRPWCILRNAACIHAGNGVGGRHNGATQCAWQRLMSCYCAPRAFRGRSLGGACHIVGDGKLSS